MKEDDRDEKVDWSRSRQTHSSVSLCGGFQMFVCVASFTVSDCGLKLGHAAWDRQYGNQLLSDVCFSLLTLEGVEGFGVKDEILIFKVFKS